MLIPLPAQAANIPYPTAPVAAVDVVAPFITDISTPQFPDRTKEVQAAAEYDQKKSDCMASGGDFSTDSCVMPPPVVTTYYAAPTQAYGTLTGSYGYSLWGGNCVNEVPYALRGQGNPSSWASTTSTPYIGGAVLFYFNHTGRITGIWSNGDLEIAQQNAGGWAQTRFSRSWFRGYR